MSNIHEPNVNLWHLRINNDRKEDAFPSCGGTVFAKKKLMSQICQLTKTKIVFSLYTSLWYISKMHIDIQRVSRDVTTLDTQINVSSRTCLVTFFHMRPDPAFCKVYKGFKMHFPRRIMLPTCVLRVHFDFTQKKFRGKTGEHASRARGSPRRRGRTASLQTIEHLALSSC